MNSIISPIVTTVASSLIIGLALFFYYIDSSINKIYHQIELSGQVVASETAKTRGDIIALEKRLQAISTQVEVIEQNYVSLETLKRIELFLNNFTIKSSTLYLSIENLLDKIATERLPQKQAK